MDKASLCPPVKYDLMTIMQQLINNSNCSLDVLGPEPLPNSVLLMGSLFYAYFTPVIFIIGIVGNSISLMVFVCKSMRHLSASMYLASLSASDLMVLIFYVLTEWLTRGIPVLSPDSRVTFMHVNGVCHVIMYFHYVSRFLSAWLVVAFTMERYIGVCHPLHRRHICSAKSTRKIVFGLVIFSLVFNMYKPLLSKVHEVHPWEVMCTTDPKHKQLSFVLDSVYAVSITFVPFVIITVINSLIIRKH